MLRKMETIRPVLFDVLSYSRQEDVIKLAEYWKSIPKDNPENLKKKLECLHKVDKIKRESLIEPLLIIMREGLSDEDPFVRYSASKALGNAMNRCLHTDINPLLGDLISHMSTSQDSGYKGSVLDVLLHQASNPVTESQWLVFLTVLSQHWGRLCRSCLFDLLNNQYKNSITFIQQKSHCVVLCCQFLCLWKKIIKKCTMSRKEVIKEFLTPVWDLVKHLKSNIPEDRMSFRSLLKLIHVVVKNMTNVSDLGGHHRIIVAQLAKELVNCFCPKWFEEFPRGFTDGFGGELTVHTDNHPNTSVLRTMAGICIKLVLVVLRLDMDSTDIMAALTVFTSLDIWMDKTTKQRDFSWVPTVYSEQDDAWIDILMTLLKIYTEGKDRVVGNKSCDDTGNVLAMIQPHKQFLLLLDYTGFDETLLVDLLISPETCFLSYLTKYLKVVSSEWREFVETHAEYRCHASLSGEWESVESMLREESPNVQTEKIAMCLKEDTQNKMTEGLTLLQQYDDDDDDDNDNDDGGGDDDNDDNDPYDLKDGDEVEDVNMGHDKEEKTCVDNIIELSCSVLDNQVDSKKCDFPRVNFNKCLDKTMTVLIRVRLKMEKYIDSNIIQYNPKVLIHMIENVEELYEQ